ncbi:hypothetical protein [Bradyrhizobium sp. OAE829]|uniref:hypothetical protein n=1 Tax=Bradyrhizobium sp. OAE829 TaxID=2663807 RepID=UPI00178B3534
MNWSAMQDRKLNILVVYWHNAPTMRIATYDHLYCFERHLPQHRVFYLNLEHKDLPDYAKNISFDIIVFHDLFFCGRWGGPALFNRLRSQIEFLRDSPAIKIAVPQDEFISADLLCDFINSYDIRAVFSVAPASEWPKIYPLVDRQRVQFYTVLTGYLEQQTLRKIDALQAGRHDARDIDIGYRAGGRNWRQASWLGRHGVLKIEIGDRVEAHARKTDIRTDISSRPEDVFMGDAWYEFLLRCKYTIGLEGGASILDWDGTIRTRTLDYVEKHPASSLEEIESQCFPGMDGTFALFALSPRHLEACATGTCQVLIEGDYNGVLEPWVHYLPLKRDFSNLAEIMSLVKQDTHRSEIVGRAYRDIVQSGKYSYSAFAEQVLSETLQLSPRFAQNAEIFGIDEMYERAREEHKAANARLGQPVGTSTAQWLRSLNVGVKQRARRLISRAAPWLNNEIRG